MRNAHTAILIGITIIFASCENKNPAEKAGDALIRTYKNTQQFGDRTSLQNLQESIKAFYAANGRYPRDLKELEGFTGIALDSNKYEYDPLKGTIAQK